MKVLNSNKVLTNLAKQYEFRLDNLLDKIPNQTVSKNMRYIDLLSLQQYSDLKDCQLGITDKILPSLMNKNGLSYSKAINFLMSKMLISKKLKPNIYVFNKANENAIAHFSPRLYAIGINSSKIREYDDKTVLSILAHELVHCKQYLDALRIEKYGETFVDNFAKLLAGEKLMQPDIKKYIEKLNEENKKIDHALLLTFAHKQFEKKIKYIEKHPKNKVHMEIKNQLISLRENSIKLLGKIRDDSNLGQKMKVIIEELIDAPYYKASYPQVKKANRFTSLIEYQSTVTEKAILSELNKDDKKECLFKTLKNKNEYFLNFLDTNFNLRVWIKRFLNKNSKSDKGFFFGTHDLL